MESIKVCIGSNDGKTIVNSHMGDAEFFYIYDILLDGESKFIENRINSVKDIKHGKENKMQMIIKILEDTNLWIANKMSPNFKNIAKNTKYQPIIIKTEDIEDALNILKNNIEKIKELLSKRENSEFLDIIEL